LLTQLEALRDVKALDMEASAFLQVCDHMGIHAFGIIKGVSDKGDAQRTQDSRDVYIQAMTNAANAVNAYLKWKLAHDPPVPADLSES
jgi:nucleoside phosphorylase